MDNKIAQNDEILALESIYDEKMFLVDRERKNPRGWFVAHTSVPRSLCLVCNRDGKQEEIQINYLPPVILHFELVAKYPSTSPPAFLLSASWLTLKQLSNLCSHLEHLWKQNGGEVVLFQWTQFLQEETLTFLGINRCLDITSLMTWKPKKVYNIDDAGTRKASEPGSTSYKQFQCMKKEKYVVDQNQGRKTHCDHYSHEEDISKVNVRTCQTRQVFKPKTTRGQLEFDQRAVLEKKSGERLLSYLIDCYDTDMWLCLCGCFTVMRSIKSLLVNLFGNILFHGHLFEYNQYKLQETFDNEWHFCKVCLCEKQGRECMTFFTCKHIFCKDCIRSFFEIQIQDGKVRFLSCPEDGCLSQALPTQVKDLVSPELYSHYDRILLNSTLESMSDIIYCPRQYCQFPVMLEADCNMATCPSCSFVFCVYCKMVYHGISPCQLRLEEKKEIFEKYLKAVGKQKQDMEVRYGRKTLQTLVDNTLSEKWIDINSKKCPHCNTSIEKRDGCNKMTCWKCSTYFCWLCMSRLSSTSPYLHFNDLTSPCFDQLFQGIFNPADEDDWEFGQFL
ncbi:E3 ubiquitin-protein ligase RNF14-like isoform X2 [Limulus polyphemus]|uniref:RBR-type E3 ubiquitin transferase n=1 Tax=Limulus polyphemus TaxID=6850 RepID=A0ABM1S6D1_LIMPO|nr:E3 ubiquitin-protein ligase RNF14-like isoform X2 [Limulus polyphemus]